MTMDDINRYKKGNRKFKRIGFLSHFAFLDNSLSWFYFILICFLSVLFLTSSGQASNHDYQKKRIALQAGTVLLGDNLEVKKEMTILVYQGRIEKILDGYHTPKNAEIINLKTHFILPGLIDSHVHLLFEFSPDIALKTVRQSQADKALNGAMHALRTLRAGFTTVQDVGGTEEIFALRNAIEKGKIPGPRILASGRAITPTGGHGDVHGYKQEIIDLMQGRNTCDGVANCRKAVREAVKRGADVIKITATGGVLSNTKAGVDQQFFKDELKAIIETAHLLGRKVTAHAHGKTGIESALKAGIDSIEHGSYLDEKTAMLFKQKNAYLIPTLLAGKTVYEWEWLPEASRKKAKQVAPVMENMIKIAYKKGVNLAFGTDSGVSRHGDNAKEFQYLTEAGIGMKEAIIIATKNAADHLGILTDTGTIEQGKYADIIAVKENPLEDYRSLLNIDFVMKQGMIYKTPN